MRDVDAAVNVIHVTCAGQGPLMVQRRQDCYNILSLADTLIPALQLIGREFIAFSAGAWEGEGEENVSRMEKENGSFLEFWAGLLIREGVAGIQMNLSMQNFFN